MNGQLTIQLPCTCAVAGSRNTLLLKPVKSGILSKYLLYLLQRVSFCVGIKEPKGNHFNNVNKVPGSSCALCSIAVWMQLEIGAGTLSLSSQI